MIGITKKREVTKQKIYKLQQDGLTPREIRFKLNLSYHRYRNNC
jgi:lipase chaperone LimK